MKFSSKVLKCGLSPMRKFHPYAVAAEAKGSAPTPVEAGELTVSANVTAIFALLSADDEMPQDGGAMDQDQGSADAEGDAPVAN